MVLSEEEHPDMEIRQCVYIMIRSLMMLTLWLTVAGPADAEDVSRVLVLNAYHAEFEWTRNIVRAIQEEFEKSGLAAEFSIEYMDTKRHNPVVLFPHLKSLYQVKYQPDRFDVIIAADTNALVFLKRFRQQLFPEIPIVFCGVNHVEEILIDSGAGITGVGEEIDVQGTLELALKLHPGTSHVAVLSDATPTDDGNRQQLERAKPAFADTISFIDLIGLSPLALKKALAQLPETTVLVLFDLYRDQTGTVLSLEEGMALLRDSTALPVYSLWEDKVKYGALGGVVINGTTQGTHAARMALRILRGESPTDIPILRKSPNVTMFNYRELHRFNIRPTDLPDGTVLINEPQHLTARVKKFLLGGVLFLVLQSAVILFLWLNIVSRKRAENALQESQERFNLAMQATSDGLFDWNAMTHEVYYSPGWKRMLGYTEDELESDFAVWERLTAPEDVKKAWKVILDVIEGKRERFEMEFTMRHKDGHWVDILSRANAVRDEHGKAVRVVGTHVNISARKQAERRVRESEWLLRTVIDTSPNCIYIKDNTGKYLLANAYIADLYAMSPDEMLGKTDDDLAHHSRLTAEEASVFRRDDLDVMTTHQKIFISEEPFTCVDGVVQWFQTTKIPITLKDHPRCILGVSENITMRKQAEHELQEYREQLEKIIEDRTRELKEAQEQLVRQEKLAVLGRLAGSVAHELRHPLGVLSNAAYFLNMSLTDLDKTTRDYLDIITTKVRDADKIIAKLLDFSRNQLSEKSVKVRTTLTGLLDEVLLSQPPPDDVDIVSGIDTGLPPVSVDPKQIKQVLANLVSNAYQAMPEGGQLTISVVFDRGNIRISLTDTGCGIAPEHMEKVFEPLFTTRQRGIGLGLAICKILVEVNGGRIAVESEEGHGSTFTISLPMDYESSPSSE